MSNPSHLLSSARGKREFFKGGKEGEEKRRGGRRKEGRKERREKEREDSNDSKTYYKHYLVLRYVRIHLILLDVLF